MTTPIKGIRCAVIDISPAYYELKKIVEDFGETVSMSLLLKNLLTLWEYYHAVPEEYPNKLHEASESLLERESILVTRKLPPSNENVGSAIYEAFTKSANGESLKANVCSVFHEVVQIIAHYLPTMFVSECDRCRSTIIDVRFIIVGKQISGIVLLEDNRGQLPPTNASMYEEYRNRQHTTMLDTIEPSEALALARTITRSAKKKKVK